jgi:hypothetical protein
LGKFKGPSLFKSQGTDGRIQGFEGADATKNLVPRLPPEPKFRIPPFLLMYVVKTSFGPIPSTEQSKRDFFITVIQNIFAIFYLLSTWFWPVGETPYTFFVNIYLFCG